MSAGSRKKHNNSHKQYQGGGQDHLEVESLLAGAGNGRDVEERLSAGVKAAEALDPAARERLDKAIEGVTNLPTNEQGMVNADDLVKAGSELNESLKQIANPAPPEDGIMGGVPGIGNEGPVSAGNADTEQQPEPLIVGINADVVRSSVFVPNKQYEGRNIIAVVTRGVRETFFEEDFNERLKIVIELHAVKIKGLRTGFKVGEYSKTQTRVIHATSAAQFTWQEREGRIIDNLMHHWGDRYNDYLLDAEQAKDNRSYKAKISLDDVTVDVVFFETDVTQRKVIAAWKGKNLFPAHYIGLDSARDVAGYPFGSQSVTALLDGLYTRGAVVMEEAQQLLDGIAILSGNPYLAQPREEVV